MTALAGCIILVVEDEPLVALDIAECFERVGATSIIARTLADAMDKTDTPGLTGAVIDHALHDGITTSDVCEKLSQLNVPFIVYSGYNKLDGACAQGKLVQKPATSLMLLTTLKGVLAEHRRQMN